MEENDEERRALTHKFYQIYRPLQRMHSLRYHMHFDVYGNNLIEIWEYEGEQRKRRICKVKEESDIECYKRAIDELKSYGEESEGKTYAKRAG